MSHGQSSSCIRSTQTLPVGLCVKTWYQQDTGEPTKKRDWEEACRKGEVSIRHVEWDSTRGLGIWNTLKATGYGGPLFAQRLFGWPSGKPLRDPSISAQSVDAVDWMYGMFDGRNMY